MPPFSHVLYFERNHDREYFAISGFEIQGKTETLKENKGKTKFDKIREDMMNFTRNYFQAADEK